MRQRKGLVSASNPDGPGHSLAEETDEIMDKVDILSNCLSCKEFLMF